MDPLRPTPSAVARARRRARRCTPKTGYRVRLTYRTALDLIVIEQGVRMTPEQAYGAALDRLRAIDEHHGVATHVEFVLVTTHDQTVVCTAAGSVGHVTEEVSTWFREEQTPPQRTGKETSHA